MAIENDGNLEDILTTPPQQDAEVPQSEAVKDVQADSTPQLQASEPQAEPVASSLPESLVGRAKAAGLQLDGISSPDQMAELILDRYLQERAYADYGRQTLASSQQINNNGNSANQEGQSDASEEEGNGEFDEAGHFSGLWKVGELDEACKYAIQNGIVTLGEDGLFTAKPGYEQLALPILNTINQAHLAQKEHVSKLFEGNFYQNVDKGLWPAFEARFNRMLDERLNARFQGYEAVTNERAFIDSFVNDNKSWLYDQHGNISPEGMKFQETVAELRKNGINDPQVLANYAIKIAGINTNAGSPVAAPTNGQPQAQQPAPNNDKPRDAQGRYLPAGTPAPVPQKSKQESFIDRARRHVSNADSRGGGLNSGADYQVANDADLENMFTDAWKHAAVA